MATACDVRHGSLADFLAWERQQPERYERVGGVIRMMTGGTVAHNRIPLDTAYALRRQLRGGDCEPFVSDIKVVSPTGDVMYPDVVVVCEPVPDKATEIDAPVVMAEVLSESTAERDQGRKRWACQTIPALRHCLLIGHDEPTVEVAPRDEDGSRRSRIHRGLDARLRLDALGVEVGLAEIFARVSFAPAAPGEEGERAG